MTDTGPRYRIEPDGDGQLTLWDYQPDPWNPHGPVAITTQGEQPPEVWALILTTHAPPPPATAADPGAAWCPECRKRRPVIETFTSGHLERQGEVAYGVTLLDCGHSLQGPPSVVTAAPGAPYAGDRVTAPTSRPTDLLDAAKRQQLHDLIAEGQL